MPDVCKVAGCRDGQRKHSKGSALFSLPTDPDLREKWLEFARLAERDVSKSAKICSYHFQEKYISHNQKRMRLSRSAVPTLHPPKVPAINVVEDDEAKRRIESCCNMSEHQCNITDEQLLVEYKYETDPLSITFLD